MRALPSGVLGPVDRPPCSRQRALPVSGGFWHAVPLRVLASHRWPGPFCPKGHSLGLVFMVVNYRQFMYFYYIPNRTVLRGARIICCILNKIDVLFSITSKAHTSIMPSILGWIIFNV